MALDRTGMKEAILRLQKLGATVPDSMDVDLREAAIRLQNTARDMAPIDFGELRSAIRLRRLGGAVRDARGRFVKGQSTYVVYIRGEQPVVDPDKLAEGITQVGQYAWEVHEHMGWAGTWRPLMPSMRSVMAGRAAGVIAGGQFMRRALQKINGEKGGAITASLALAANKAVKNLDK